MYLFSDLEVYLKESFKIYVFIVKLRSIREVYFLNWCNSSKTPTWNRLEVDFQYWYVYFQMQKYTWGGLPKFMYSCSNSEIHKKEIFHIDVFLFKLTSILEVEFQYRYTYFETLKYIWSRLSKFMYLSSNSGVYLK